MKFVARNNHYLLAFALGVFASSLFFVPPRALADELSADEQAADELASDDYDDEEEVSDPLEGWNRGVFWFNDHLDMYLLEPIADGYDYIMPEPVQTGVVNVFDNLAYPKYLVSSVFQLKFEQAAEHTGRFLINSTLGLAGIFDVAKHFGLEKHSEDFGTALGYHGVGPGPYLVLPILGPSNFRDGFGRIVDGFLNPVPWIAAETSDGSDAAAITLGVTALDAVQTRADLDEAIEAAKEASLDYYLFVQSAYYQNRKALINDKQVEKDESEGGDPADDPFAEDEAFDEMLENAGE